MENEQLRLIPFKEAHYQAIFKDDNVLLGKLLNIETPTCWTTFEEARNAVPALYNFFLNLNGDERWGSYFIIHKNDNRLAGTGGYKGLPNAGNEVEIGYEIHPDYQQRGFATMVSQMLVNFAFTQNISTVLAHTLPEENSSTNVLKKTGFQFIETINDPEDGTIWKWQLLKENFIGAK